MDLNSYQEYAMKTSLMDDPSDRVQYGVLNLAGEAGEVTSLFAKSIRDKTELEIEDLIKELGDALWCIACVADGIGVPLRDVAMKNLRKLNDRQERGVLEGSGDDR